MAPYYWQDRLVRLRAAEPDDWELLWRWNRDGELLRHLEYLHPPQSQAAVKRWLEETATRQPKDDEFGVTIETLAGEPVGGLGTHDCDSHNGTFSYGLSIAQEHRRRGYAQSAIRLILRYFFEERRYRKAWVHVYGFNEASLRLHERLGFQHEGRLRQMVFTQGRYHDIIVLGLLADEYAAGDRRTGEEGDG
jgi:RimJ/RimL family protein N-acetyltransferase